MKADLRKSGNEFIGKVWGTHVCQFYQDKEDLIEILLPYFKQGLENNEFCMWVTSEPLNVEDAKKALKEKVKNLDDYIKKSQIEILDYSQWYTKTGRFDADKVLEGWVEKEKKAIKKGFDGLRLTGNTFWLEKKDWENFANYEAIVNSVIRKHRMLAICSYSLDKCQASEIIDVVNNHHYALIKKKGEWVSLESSEHKRTDEALWESETRYRAIYETSADAIMTLTPEEGFLSGNPATVRMFGCSGEEDFIQYDPAGLSPEYQPDGKPSKVKAQEMMAIAMEKGSHFFEWTYRRKGGADFFAMVLFTRMVLKDKKLLQATVRDITEYKRAGDVILKLNDCFLNFGTDPEKNIELIVAAAGTILGGVCALYNKLDGEILTTIADWKAPSDMERQDATRGHICYDVITGNKDLLIVKGLPDTSYARTDPNVRRYGLKTYIGHVVMVGGKPAASLCVVYQEDRDFVAYEFRAIAILAKALSIEEERKMAEEELQRFLRAVQISQAQYEQTVSMISDVVWRYEVDAQGQFVRSYISPVADRLLALPAGTIGNNFEKYIAYIHPDDHSVMQEMLSSGLRTRLKMKESDYRLIKPDGTIIWAYSRGSAYAGDNGATVGFGTTADITERKKAEEELRLAYKKLKQTQQELIQASKMAAMGQLAAGISHELNQPLAGIKGFAQAVLMDLGKESPFRNDLNKIVGQVDRVDTIIKNVRFFARKSDFNMADLDINQVIVDSLMLLSQQLKVHNIKVIREFGSDIPKIQGDPNQLQQAFFNIINNSRDAILCLNRPEGGEIRLRTSLGQGKDHIEITFQDTGCGIPEENLQHIFSPFFTTKSPDKGMGLGLSIAYRIIENHQGKIEFQTQVGKGTIFRIVLPSKGEQNIKKVMN